MAWTKGWNFRSTAAYVTDTGNNTYELGDLGDDYPVTRNGVTFGYTLTAATFSSARDRSTGVGEQFAGKVFANIVAFALPFQVDLPATGQYLVRISGGDQAYANNIYLVVKDNTSVLTTVSGATSGSNQYLDATSVNRSSPSDWISNNAAYTGTFATTTFMLVIGDGATLDGNVTHLTLDQVASGTVSQTSFLQVGRGFA